MNTSPKVLIILSMTLLAANSMHADDHQIRTINNKSNYDLVIHIADSGETAVSADGKTTYRGGGGNEILIGAQKSLSFKRLPIGGTNQALSVSLKQGSRVISEDTYFIWKDGPNVLFGMKPVRTPHVNVTADANNIITIESAS